MSDWKNNRPLGWGNPYPDLTEEALTEKYLIQAMEEPKSNYEIFEAGADAMLEAIKARGHILGESLRNVKGAIGWASIDPNSKWYPIPDEESK